jgi:hypothetical protein
MVLERKNGKIEKMNLFAKWQLVKEENFLAKSSHERYIGKV